MKMGPGGGRERILEATDGMSIFFLPGYSALARQVLPAGEANDAGAWPGSHTLPHPAGLLTGDCVRGAGQRA